VEEHDFRATLKQVTQERADFTKGLVTVKEYEAHTERLRVEQDKLKVEREKICHRVLTRRVCLTDCVIIVSIWVSSLTNCKMTQLLK
jgi:hypothetical protein